MTNLDAILAKATEKAIAKGRKKTEQLAEKQVESRKAKMANWQERQRERRNKEREARIKNGAQICETFVQEVADAFLRLAGREDRDKFESLKISFYPGKSDVGTTTAVIFDGVKRLTTFYKSSLQQLVERDERQMQKLQESTGFAASSPVEMLEEIQRLQGELERVKSGAEDRDNICQLAHQLVLARTENRDLDAPIKALEAAFLK